MLQLMAITALVAILTQHASAHSWIEQMQVIGSNGTYTGNYGYPRGYMARTDPGYNGMSDMYLVPALDTGRTRINASDYLCHPSQRAANYTSKYPRLSVSAGDWIAMKYLENGHVTQPWVQAGKPSAGGTVFVYGTTTPDPDVKIVDVLEWTSEGTGGNGKGWLMTAQNFDDGRCHQISEAAISLFRQQANGDHVEGQPTSQIEQWCETDVNIPHNTTSSSLTAYWIWQWPTAVGTVGAPAGKDEYYTTCMDFDVHNSNVDAGQALAQAAAAPPMYALPQQDPQTDAVSGYSTRSALTPSPAVITAGQTLAAAEQRLSVTPTISMLYSLAGSTITASGTTYALEPQGTALLINGLLAAYVNCNNAVATGSIAPTCAQSTLAAPPATSAPPALSTAAATSAVSIAPDAQQGATSATKTLWDTTTIVMTVTASAPSIVMEVGQSPVVGESGANMRRGRYFRRAYQREVIS